MPQPAKSPNSRPGSTPLQPTPPAGRRRWAVAAGALFSQRRARRGRRPSPVVGGRVGGSPPRRGEKPTLSQWYQGYGEEGVEDAVRRFAADYPDATVEVQWFPADYTTTVTAALLTDEGPDVFEIGNGPNIDMITSGQVLPLDGILGDAESDFNERMIKRLTYDGHLWAVPQVIDMYFLVYRKSWLERRRHRPAGDRRRPHRRRGRADHRRPLRAVPRQRRRGRPDGRHGAVVGRRRLPHRGRQVRVRQRRRVRLVRQAATRCTRATRCCSAHPTDWSDPGSFINELTAIQLTGLWTFPAIQASAIGDDFDMIPWPALSSSVGGPSLPVGAFSSTVSARTKYPDAAKAFVKWLWVDNTDAQLEFALDYGFHIPARNSLAERGRAAEDGGGGQRARRLPAVRVHPDARAVDAGVGPGVLRRPHAHHHRGRRPGRGDRQGERGRRQRAGPPRRVERRRAGERRRRAEQEAAGTMAAGTVPATTG